MPSETAFAVRTAFYMRSGGVCLEALRQHRIGSNDEKSNVRTIDVVYCVADFAVFQTGFVDALHDAEQALVDFFTSQDRRMAFGSFPNLKLLRHKQWRLFQGVEDVGFDKLLDRAQSRRHIRTFGNDVAAVCQQGFGGLFVQFVLGRAGQGDFGGDAPRFWFLKVLQTLLFGVGGNAFAADFFQFDQGGELRYGHTAVGEEDEAVGVGNGQHFRAQLDGFFGGVLRHVAGTGNQDAFAFKTIVAGLQHRLGEIDAAVASRFGTDEAAAPFQTFAGQDGRKLVADFCIVRTDSRFRVRLRRCRQPERRCPRRCGGRVRS